MKKLVDCPVGDLDAVYKELMDYLGFNKFQVNNLFKRLQTLGVLKINNTDDNCYASNITMYTDKNIKDYITILEIDKSNKPEIVPEKEDKPIRILISKKDNGEADEPIRIMPSTII
jgi:hypothetical protein